MSSKPSVKGTLFRLVAADVGKRVANGQISEAALSRYLEPDDRALLDRKILAVEWVDVRAFERLMLLLRDEVGHGRDDYLIRSGALGATYLIQRGTYKILDVLKNPSFRRESDPAARFRAYGEDLRMLVTLASTLNNFGVQTVELDPEHAGRYRLEIRDAAGYPDVMAISNQGFVNRFFEELGDPDLLRWKRISEDEIHYTMVRPPKLT